MSSVKVLLEGCELLMTMADGSEPRMGCRPSRGLGRVPGRSSFTSCFTIAALHKLSEIAAEETECVCACYLPGVTAPPAGLRGDAQARAAGLLGHEGELSHRATSETMKCARHGNTHHGCPGNQEEEEREGQMHAGKDAKRKKNKEYY